MASINPEDVRKSLDRIKRFKHDLPLYDCHAHPFEALFCENGWAAGEQRGAEERECVLPLPEPGEITDPAEDEWGEPAERFGRAAQVLSLRSRFRYASPAGFLSHMRAAALDVCLLLPIAPAAGRMDSAMALMGRLFGREERFLLGCSVPNAIALDAIDGFLRSMKSAYRVKAVKIHHNISEIDLSASWGKERTEAVLEACATNHLPLVVHGGRSRALKHSGARAYARIENLKEIDWGRSAGAVVLAHGGAYECSGREVDQEVLPALNALLSRHPNLFIDLSGLSCDVQIRMLRRVAPERIVFGSDALYNSPWKEAAKLVHSLELAGMKVEESYLTIAHRNPERVLFKRTVSHARSSAHTAVSAC